MEVIILAGGLGTRLRSVVSDVPKCMAPVDGKPFLWYLLEHLRLFNVTHVILSVGYLRESVQDWVERHKGDYPFRFSFAVEEEPLGTGGGIALASTMVHGREAVVLNGDTFFDADLDELLELRRSSGRPVALALKKMRSFDRYGTVELSSEGLVTGFREKQYCAEGLINGGVYALDLDAGVFDGLEGKFSFERDVLEPCCARGLICGTEQSGYFLDIGIPADYSRAVERPSLLHH
ncbi:MAG: nucleotidyltransferase family protein, partial [Bacteroidales bacterium]|nr:nucleotidyltransferase family protein [Bacteroidales bacterium]